MTLSRGRALTEATARLLLVAFQPRESYYPSVSNSISTMSNLLDYSLHYSTSLLLFLSVCGRALMDSHYIVWEDLAILLVYPRTFLDRIDMLRGYTCCPNFWDPPSSYLVLDFRIIESDILTDCSSMLREFPSSSWGELCWWLGFRVWMKKHGLAFGREKTLI